MCRQHGIMVETRGHNCAFKNCDCSRCLLIRQRRRIMSTQIRLRRAQDKKFQRTSEPAEADVILQTRLDSGNADDQPNRDVNTTIDAKNMCYFCQKCKNHGILMWKKDHKRHCQFAECTCEQCELIETRRKLDQHLKGSRSVKGSLSKGVIEYASPRSDTSSGSCSSPLSDKALRDEKTITNVSEVGSICMPLTLPATIPNEALLFNPLNSTSFSMLPLSQYHFQGFPSDLSSLVALPVNPSTPFFGRPSLLPSSIPSILLKRPFNGGLSTLPTEPVGGQIPEEISAFTSFLNSVCQIETILHHQQMNLTM